MEGFEVIGFEVKRSGDDFGIIIYGHRKLQDGRTVKFSTPFIAKQLKTFLPKVTT